MNNRYKRYFLALPLLFLSFAALSQPFIRGKVVDSAANTGLQGASLKLLTLRDSLLEQRASGTEGTFQLKSVPPGRYRLQVNFLGYRPVFLTVTVPAGEAPQPLSIRLIPEYRALEEVAIIAAPPVAVLKGDTTEFDASAFSTEPYADADALIMQIPGVEIDEEGKVKAQGEDVQRIIVDGKEFFSTDPRIALKTLPADIISKIQ